MSQDDDRATRIMAEAEQLVSDIQRQLDAGEDFYREHGLDRNKMRETLSPKDKEESQRLLAEDMAAVEREVDEAKARQSFSTNRPTGTRAGKNRTMI